MTYHCIKCILFRVIAPIEAVAIIGWWAYDLISGDAGDGEKWYEFGRETLVMTLTQVGNKCMMTLVTIFVLYQQQTLGRRFWSK